MKGYQAPSGTVIVFPDEPPASISLKVAVYARVSSAENTSNLDSQAERLVAYLTAIIYSFCARLYGQPRAKRKTEKIVQELEANDATRRAACDQANG